ncbi:MAG: MBL fold metallo-hydrolase [Myxococcales bacterium]|nr:MBL fold metallo-hydrolase [Myxococcales bacterium]
MRIGFDTIGNALLIAYDGKPVVVTDPWFVGSAYFGSWGLSHEIPDEQREAILGTEYVWISHGHPDHLSWDSIALLKDKKLLLPNHVGRRIAEDLTKQGYDVQVLPDRKWVRLSERVQVLCISDFNQDAILLLDINGWLVVNQNDAGDYGWHRFVSGIVKKHGDKTVQLHLSSQYGDADMLNYFDEAGNRIPPTKVVPDIGARNLHRTQLIGCKYYGPFSSMHSYQREDSAWAREYGTSLEDYKLGWSHPYHELLPPFVRFDCEAGTYSGIGPKPNPAVTLAPETFGDSWSEPLEKQDVLKIARYFRRIEHMNELLRFINVRVGGEDHIIDINPKVPDRGITFEAPRHSFMTCIDWEIFDDVLIGNFMKVTLHGPWKSDRLYPDFTPFVAKYADNGRAYTAEEVAAYKREYALRAPVDALAFEAQFQFEQAYRKLVPDTSVVHKLAKQMYWAIRKS